MFHQSQQVIMLCSCPSNARFIHMEEQFAEEAWIHSTQPHKGSSKAKN